MIDDKYIRFLLSYCSTCPELYNKVANQLYKNFRISGAELALLVTFFVHEHTKGGDCNVKLEP